MDPQGATEKAGTEIQPREPATGWQSLKNKGVRLAVSASLAVAVFLVFGQTLWHDFVNYDDPQYVYENLVVRKGLTVHGLSWAWRYGEIGHWHPLTWLSHMLDCQLYGLWAGGHHLTNVLLHTLTTILLFLTLRRLTRTQWASAFVAAVFAVHPLHVESVAWISERKDVLSGLFFVLVLGTYSRYIEALKAGGSRLPNESKVSSFPRSAALWYGIALVAFALGLLSKNMLVTTPFVLLLLDYWPLARIQSSGGKSSFAIGLRLAVEKAPFLALSAASCLITSLVPETVSAPFQVPLGLRVENAFLTYAIYLRQFVFPKGLWIPYLYPASHTFPWWQVAAAVLLLLGISCATILCRKTHRYLLVGWFWYLGMLVPAIGLIQISYYARADRYTYLPQIGLSVAVAWGVLDLAKNRSFGRWWLGVAGALVTAGLILCARGQTAYWYDSVSLWTHTLACSPDNVFAGDNYHAAMGYQLGCQGRLAEAIEQYETIVRTAPVYIGGEYMATVHYNLGTLLARLKAPEEAIEHFRRALELKPDYAEAHNNLGNMLASRGRFDEAIAEFQAALHIEPDYADAHNGLADTLVAKGRIEEAIAQYQQTIRIKPDYYGAYYNLGTVFGAQGRLKEAADSFQEAIRINSNSIDAHGNLAKMLSALGRHDEAILQFRKTLDLAPNSIQGHYRLGQALEARRDFSAASAEYEATLRLDPGHLPARTNLAWLLATCPDAPIRNGAKAVELARPLVETSKHLNPELLDILAAACAEAGQYDQAVESARKALELAEAADNQPLAQAVRNRLTLYEARSPFRQP
jgi:tetratricopeptide (TPR) repeat protein